LGKLKAQSYKNNRYKDKQLVQKLWQMIQETSGYRVLLYIPMKMEVDIYSLLKRLKRDRRYTLFVPYIDGINMSIAQYRLPISIGKYDIKQPRKPGHNSQIDIAVVPIVAYDIKYRRIGFGKGYYDKFFSKLKSKPWTIFVQRLSFQAENNITNSFDIKADKIIKGTR